MRNSAFASSFIARLRTRRNPAAARRAQQNGNAMSIDLETKPTRKSRLHGSRAGAAALVFIAALFLSLVPLVGLTTTAARACACGCSVFDVGGLDLPQEQDHGGRVFFEFWGTDQTQNYVGSSKAPAAINLDKRLNTQWYNGGFSYNFNRDWGVMLRIPTANRTLTTDTGAYAGITSFNSKDVGDIEIMGIYTGFFKDMSTGSFSVSSFRPVLSRRSGWTATIRSERAVPTFCSARTTAAFSAVTMPGNISHRSCGGSHSFIRRASTRRRPLTEIQIRQSNKPTFQGCRSTRPPASFITTCTMCSASTRSRRSGR